MIYQELHLKTNSHMKNENVIYSPYIRSAISFKVNFKFPNSYFIIPLYEIHHNFLFHLPYLTSRTFKCLVLLLFYYSQDTADVDKYINPSVTKYMIDHKGKQHFTINKKIKLTLNAKEIRNFHI